MCSIRFDGGWYGVVESCVRPLNQLYEMWQERLRKKSTVLVATLL